MSNQNNISKLKELPESIKQFGGLISIIIIIFLSFFILNKMFGQGDELVAKMKAEEERIKQEKLLAEKKAEEERKKQELLAQQKAEEERKKQEEIAKKKAIEEEKKQN